MTDLPSWLDPELWSDFIEHRKEIGYPLTATGAKRMLIKLYRMKEAGEDVDLAIERTINSGKWRDVFPVPPDLKPSKHTTHQDAKKQDLPEVDDEKAAENIRKLQESLGEVINISGGRR